MAEKRNLNAVRPMKPSSATKSSNMHDLRTAPFDWNAEGAVTLFRAGWRASLLVILALTIPVGATLAQGAPSGAPKAVGGNGSGHSVAYRFAQGSSITYRLDYDSRSNADLRKLFQGNAAPPGGQTQASNLVYALIAGLHGTYSCAVVRAAAARVESLCTIQNATVQVNVNSNEQTSQAAAVAADLQNGFLVTMTPEGKVIALNMPPGASKFSQDFAKALLGSFEFVVVANAGGGKWQEREADRDGEYIANYAIGGAQVSAHAGNGAGQIAISKNVARYLAPKEPEGSTTMPGRIPAKRSVTPSGSLEAHLDPARGILTSLSGREIKDTSIQGTNIAHSETIVRLTLVSRDEIAAAQLASYQKEADSLRAASAPLAVFSEPNPVEVETNIQRTELGNATFEELMVQLGTVELGDGKMEETPVYLKFKALVYLHPEDCTKLAKAVEGVAATTPTFRILVGGLGAVGNPEAQAALMQIMEKRTGDWPALAELIATLGGEPHPTPESEHAVYQVATNSADANVSAAALLALGSMAGNLRTADAKRSAAIIEELTSLLSMAPSDDQREHVLEALGNSASEASLPIFLKYAKSETPGVRAAAMDGLRNIRSARADTTLLQALGTDMDKQVRLEAAFALGFRKPSADSFSIQRQALKEEEDDKVRAAILGNLAKMASKFPESRKVIANSAANDPSEYVRKTAIGLLNSELGESSARN